MKIYKKWFTRHETPIVIPTENTPPKSTAARSLKYIVNHWRIIAIVSAVIGMLVLIVSLWPVVQINRLQLANLGASVTLQDGQTAKLKVHNVTVKITHFTNQMCAQVGKCFGDDIQSVEYELNVNGKKYATGSASAINSSPYQIVTESSDYASYSVIKIIKSN